MHCDQFVIAAHLYHNINIMETLTYIIANHIGSFLDDKLAAGHIRMCAYALKEVKPPTDSPRYIRMIYEIIF